MTKKRAQTPSFMVDANGAHDPIDAGVIAEHLEAGEFFWLDLHKPSTHDLGLLSDVFKLHPLAVEDAAHFGQRPKHESFDDFVYLVVYGANEDKDGLVEVHCFFSGTYLVTVHRDDCPPFAELRRRATAETQPPAQRHQASLPRRRRAGRQLLPRALASSTTASTNSRTACCRSRTTSNSQEFSASNGGWSPWRKVITPERDLFARIVTGVIEIPGMTPDMERYYRDVYDHLIRISDLVDSYRDLLTGAMDVYLSTVSNRLNEVMKRLTIVATIFMPLTWITGFFGMNFRTCASHHRLAAFVLCGLLTQVVAVGVMFVLFRRGQWI